MWNDLWIALPALLMGLFVTLQLSAAAVASGTLLGFLCGLGLSYGNAPIRVLLRGYVDTIRGIPVLVLIFASFYGFPFLSVQTTAFAAGVIALSAFATAHMAEIVRGGIESIPAAQSDAAKAVGLPFWGRLRWVIIPQALRRVTPPWVNMAVEMVKASSLVSLIGVVDLLLATQQAIGRTFLTLQFYILACLLYFAINFSISQLGVLYERRLSRLGWG